MKSSACELSHFSHVWLFVTLWTVAHQATLSMGFSRQEYWRGLPCPPPGDLPEPGIGYCIKPLGGAVYFMGHSLLWPIRDSSRDWSFGSKTVDLVWKKEQGTRYWLKCLAPLLHSQFWEHTLFVAITASSLHVRHWPKAVSTIHSRESFLKG